MGLFLIENFSEKGFSVIPENSDEYYRSIGAGKRKKVLGLVIIRRVQPPIPMILSNLFFLKSWSICS